MRKQSEIINLCKMEELPFDMRKRQIEAIDSFIEGNNVALFLPTGYGKTLPAKLAAKYIWETQGRKTLVIGLLKALTAEQYEEFNKMVPTIIDDGDHRQDISVYENNEWVIACLTPERFDSIMNSPAKREKVMKDVGLIVTDEAHNIASRSRGHRMENYIITTRTLYPEMRYIYLSATVGNPKEFSTWLEADLILAKPEERPVPLNLKLIPYEEIMYPFGDIPDFKANYNLRVDMLIDLIQSMPDKNWLVFVTARNRTYQIANDLVGDRRKHNLQDLVEEQGIGFHNAGMSKEERIYVEQSFRNGTIKICVATPTLAVGVNLPADCCVVFDVEQYSSLDGNVPIDANRLQQTIGRAGRPNLSEIGYAFIFTPQRLYEVIEDRAINPLIVQSTLKPRLHEKILQWVAGRIATDNVDIKELCSMSYSNLTEEESKEAINWLIAFGYLKQTNEGGIDTLKITPIGLKTVSMYVIPETVNKWQAQICNIKDATSFREIYTRFGSVEEYFDNVVVRDEDYDKINIAKYELGSIMPESRKSCGRLCLTCYNGSTCKDKKYEMKECERYVSTNEAFINDKLLKCFALSFFEDLSKKYTFKKTVIMSLGDKAVLKEAGSRIFNAAGVIFSEHKTLSNTLKTLGMMCEAGTLNSSLIELCRLEQIGLVRAERLYESGIKTIGEFLSADPKVLARAMKVAPRIAIAIQNKNKEKL